MLLHCVKSRAGAMISGIEMYTILVVALLAQTHLAHSLWICSKNEDCSSLSGSVCVSGECVCEGGQQAVQGGSACVDVAPYHTSPCFEDFQCNRLLSGFHCRKNGNSTEGNCVCQSGHHYFHGRCWRAVGFGQPCSRDEECVGALRDPFSMKCDVTCQCSDEYFETQRGHCRKLSTEVGQSCVIDQDCRFENGICHNNAFICTDGTEPEDSKSPFQNLDKQRHNKISKVLCNAENPCNNPFICSNFGICICPPGYYESETDNSCLAELGSASTPAQCVGFLAEIVDGICTCRNNFFFDDNMRDCVKVNRIFTDSCVSDVMCGTFGPSRCGPPVAPWGQRSCACEGSVWDQRLNTCRYFAAVGETCELDSDCLAGDLEIQCVKNDDGNSYCVCPQGLWEHEGLCLNSGLKIGEDCQSDLECTGTNNTDCVNGVCSCTEGYQKQEDGDEAICAPIIGGSCSLDSDCVIENTFCKINETSSTCQCHQSFVEYDDTCWARSPGYNASCEVSPQCSLRSSTCEGGRCVCERDYHFKDDDCWPVTALFSPCSRSSQCFLSDHPERAVCRNSACQCDFDYPFSESLNTCSSSSTSRLAAVLLVIAVVVQPLLHQ